MSILHKLYYPALKDKYICIYIHTLKQAEISQENVGGELAIIESLAQPSAICWPVR